MKIKFGTSGWRAIIAEDFTFDNVRLLSQAVANYLKKSGLAKKGIVIGHDSRFLSSDFAQEAAKVIASNNIKVYFPQRPTPTPVISYTIINKKLGGAIIISASHNPAVYNGFKFSSANGGPSSKKVTKIIEKEVTKINLKKVKLNEKLISKNIKKYDPSQAYFKKLNNVLGIKTLRKNKFKIALDCMNGIASGYLDKFLKDLGYDIKVINDAIDPSYGGRNPDPSPEDLSELIALVKKKNYALGLSVDGDSDRFGVIDKAGDYVIPNKIIAIIFYYLVQSRKNLKTVARSISTTHLVDEIAKDFNYEVVETPIGFKYIAEQLLTKKCILGAEESGGLSIAGHIPEKDGILANLLVVEALAYFKKPLKELLSEIHRKYGYFYNERLDLKMSWNQQSKFMDKIKKSPPKTISGKSIKNINKLDGYKFILENDDWLMFRPSGTEPMVRCYIESRTKKGFKALKNQAQKMI
jgi:alpha-D-glucose phosphate-specific phosphoglucomutase